MGQNVASLSHVVRFELGVADLASIRFGISPGYELCHAIRALLRPYAFPLQWGWLQSAREQGGLAEFGLLADVIGPDDYLPDFLSAAPSGDMTAEQELDRLRATPQAQISRDLHKMVLLSRGPRRERLIWLRDHPRSARTRIADAWSVMWDEIMAGKWTQLQRLARADVAVRARRSSDQGLAAMIASLHAAVSWDGTAVAVRTRFFTTTVDCAGDGLLLVPSVMMEHDRCAVIIEKPALPVLFYPAHGISERWYRADAERDEALANLVGPSRGQLLAVLHQPLSTSEAAAACSLSVPTASHHLSILRTAGLVHSRRAGRQVLHTLTTMGEALTRA